MDKRNSNIIKSINRLVVFAFPLSMNLLINMIPGFVAILMVAKLGKIELAAGSLAVATYTPIMMAVSTIFYAVGILISHSRGQKKNIERYWQYCTKWILASHTDGYNS